MSISNEQAGESVDQLWEEQSRLYEKLVPFKDVQKLIYRDSKSTYTIKYTTREWAEECYALLKSAFENGIDTLFFRGKSARGYGTLAHTMKEAARYAFAKENGVRLSDVKIPRICFVDDFPSEDIEGFKEKFGIKENEKILFFDEASTNPEPTIHKVAKAIAEGIHNVMVLSFVGGDRSAGIPESGLVFKPWMDSKSLLYNIAEANRRVVYDRPHSLIEGSIRNISKMYILRFPDRIRSLIKEARALEDAKDPSERNIAMEPVIKFCEKIYSPYWQPPFTGKKNEYSRQLNLSILGLDRVFELGRKLEESPFSEWSKLIPEIERELDIFIETIPREIDDNIQGNKPLDNLCRQLCLLRELIKVYLKPSLHSLPKFGIAHNILNLAALRKQARDEMKRMTFEFLERHESC